MERYMSIVGKIPTQLKYRFWEEQATRHLHITHKRVACVLVQRREDEREGEKNERQREREWGERENVYNFNYDYCEYDMKIKYDRLN